MTSKKTEFPGHPSSHRRRRLRNFHSPLMRPYLPLHNNHRSARAFVQLSLLPQRKGGFVRIFNKFLRLSLKSVDPSLFCGFVKEIEICNVSTETRREIVQLRIEKLFPFDICGFDLLWRCPRKEKTDEDTIIRFTLTFFL